MRRFVEVWRLLEMARSEHQDSNWRCRLLAHCAVLQRAPKRQLSGVDRTNSEGAATDENDAVDGSPLSGVLQRNHSEASECRRVVALKHTTKRGAVHGRGYHDRSRYCEVGIPGSRRRLGWGGGY